MDYLNTLGLVPRLEDGRLKVAPASRVTAESRQWIQEHKPDLIAELQQATHECPPGPLVLLVLDSGQIIQTMTDRPPGEVEQQARKAHGPHLLTVVAVPGAERFLADDELAPALNGHWQPAPEPAHQTSSRAWLTRIANLLGLPRDSLLADGWLSPEDLKEQAGSDPVQVARLIRSDPRWSDRPGQRTSSPTEAATGHGAPEAHGNVWTALQASPEWLQARDAFMNHLASCRTCHAPAGRYCAAGADLKGDMRESSL